MKMPFGKYKNVDISEVPNSYIDWIIGEGKFKDRNPKLFKELVDELAIRKRSYIHIEEEKPEPEDVDWKF